MALVFNDAMTLGEARDLLRGLVDEGHDCPLCTQLAKVYRRRLNSGMVVSLIRMYRIGATGWVHLPTQVGARSREEGKLRYWGLVVEMNTVREDGGHAGWWAVTDLGERFVLGQVRVPMYARIYDGRCLGLVGPPISIRDALGTRFDYTELMLGI